MLLQENSTAPVLRKSVLFEKLLLPKIFLTLCPHKWMILFRAHSLFTHPLVDVHLVSLFIYASLNHLKKSWIQVIIKCYINE